LRRHEIQNFGKRTGAPRDEKILATNLLRTPAGKQGLRPGLVTIVFPEREGRVFGCRQFKLHSYFLQTVKGMDVFLNCKGKIDKIVEFSKFTVFYYPNCRKLCELCNR
jgi:hypothetical protein